MTDIRAAWQSLESRYIYLNDKVVDWSSALLYAEHGADTIRSTGRLISALEGLIDNLYDPHVSLRSNTARSPRLVPSGLDVWAEWPPGEGTARVTSVRSGSIAQGAGVRPGMEVLAINGIPTRDAASARLGSALRAPVPSDAWQWALLSALAGRHDTPVVLRVRDGGTIRELSLDPNAQQFSRTNLERVPVEYERRGEIGYIRLNALWDQRSVAALDSALESLRTTRGLLLDLRNTPEGGNTGVAEPILGRFITQRSVYQLVEGRDGKRTARFVEPRGPWTYSAPVAVLVGRWTGSMGEGMAVAFDGIRVAGQPRGRVVGTPMAGLAGAVEEVTLPCSGLRLAFPTARLLHVDGTPRERWLPPLLVDLVQQRTGTALDPDIVRRHAEALLR